MCPRTGGRRDRPGSLRTSLIPADSGKCRGDGDINPADRRVTRSYCSDEHRRQTPPSCAVGRRGGIRVTPMAQIAMNPVRWLSIYFEFTTLTDSGVPSSGLTTDTGSEIATFNLVLWLTISTGMFGRPPRETGLTGRTRPSDQVFVIDPRENPTVQGMTSRKTSIKARSTAGT